MVPAPGTDFMNAMDDVMICYVLQRTRRPLFSEISVYISGAALKCIVIYCIVM